nr:MAG TPA: hypothetical protein [Caudoviricetes sp.]
MTLIFFRFLLANIFFYIYNINKCFLFVIRRERRRI